MKWFAVYACLSLLVSCSHSPRTTVSADPVQTVLRLAPSVANPRNSEGDFIRLKNGALLFVYTHFTAGAADEATAHLAQRISHDQGKTWSEDDVVLVAQEGGLNVMSVSLERITPDTIGLFYLRKNSWQDCRPMLRLSGDEGQTWGTALAVFPQEDSSYYVMNNDRVVRMRDGRLLLPLALHYAAGWSKWTGQAQILCAHSDDNGRTWSKGHYAPVAGSSESKKVTL
ncbi:MAG TPA: sialidase family protein, partial [bacterium]|nr:sialidase family protein [bacterium]